MGSLEYFKHISIHVWGDSPQEIEEALLDMIKRVKKGESQGAGSPNSNPDAIYEFFTVENEKPD